MTSLVQRVMRAIAWTFIAAACLLSYLAGPPLTYGLMATFFLLVFWSPFARQRFELDIAGLTFSAVFVLMLIINTIHGDPLITANFLLPLLFIPAVTGLRALGRPDNILLVARLALCGVIIAAVVAIYQVGVLGEPRASGLGTDALWSSTAALAIGWVAVAGVVRASGIERNLYFLGPVLGTLVIILAGSRGPLLVAVPLLLVAGIVVARRYWPGFGIVGLISAGLFALAGNRERFDSMVKMGTEAATGVSFTDYSASVRKILLDGGIGSFQQSPWIGHGWGKFLEATAPFTGRADWGTSLHGFHLHSDLLDFAVAGGVLGLLAYALLIVAPVAGAWHSRRDSQYQARLLGAVMLSAAYLGCGVTNALFGFEFHTTLYMCLAAILLGYCRDAEVKS